MITMDDNEEKVYKHTPGNFRDEVNRDIQENIQKFKDPVVLGELMYKILEERENTNRILKNILSKLEKIEESSIREETTELKKESDVVLLPEVDEEIISVIQGLNKVTAHDIKEKLGYRGTNAASSRLNRLVNAGILTKKQVGKKVFFFLVEK